MSDVKDAELLAAGRNPENAALLVAIAVRRIVEAILGTEHGWPVPARLADPGKIPTENPLKAQMARIAKLAQPAKPLALLPDGNIPKDFDVQAFRRDLAAVRSLLQDAAQSAGVSLLGDQPAEHPRAARPTPAPELAAPKPKQKLQAVPARPEEAARPVPPLQRQAIAVPDNRPAKPAAAPHVVEGRSPIEVSNSRQSMTSAAFWGLMNRWGVADLDALDLIGRSGGLSKQGTRPRFKLQGEEADIARRLFEIDNVMTSSGLASKSWVNKPIRATPFNGATPAAFIAKDGAAGAQEVSRYLLRNRLQLSLIARAKS